MIRYLVIPLLIIAGLVALWVWAGTGEPVELHWDGTIYTIGEEPRTAALVLAGLSALVIALWTLLVWLWQLPARLRAGRSIRRRDRALEAVETSLLAGAAGDLQTAEKQAARARDLSGSERLGRVLSARAAETSGNSGAALLHYGALAEDPQAAPAALRGLAEQHFRRGEYPEAVAQAHQAFARNPKAQWAFDLLFRAQVAAHDWGGALNTLAEGEAGRHIDADTARRRRAVLETALADAYEAQGRAEEAREAATAAAAREPEFAPGVALAARLLARVGETRRARKLVEAAWSRRPHPALSLAYRDLVAGRRQGLGALFPRKDMDDLVALNPAHRESRLLEVEQAIGEGEWVRAWNAIEPLLEDASSRVCLLAARIETGLGNADEARTWMERAATAPTEADWSDLDPSGEAFDYAPADWARLVSSYGEGGELIHPRLERNQASRASAHIPAMATGSAIGSGTDSIGVGHDTQAGPQVGAAVGVEPAPSRAPGADAPTSAVPAPDGSGDIATRLDKLLRKG